MKSIAVPDVETWKSKLKILEFSFILVFPLYYNMLYRYNAKQNICNLIGWNSVHIFDIFNYYYRANINEMWNAKKLGEVYKTFEFTLT